MVIAKVRAGTVGRAVGFWDFMQYDVNAFELPDVEHERSCGSVARGYM